MALGAERSRPRDAASMPEAASLRPQPSLAMHTLFLQHSSWRRGEKERWKLKSEAPFAPKAWKKTYLQSPSSSKKKKCNKGFCFCSNLILLPALYFPGSLPPLSLRRGGAALVCAYSRR